MTAKPLVLKYKYITEADNVTEWYSTYDWCKELDSDYIGDNIGIFWTYFKSGETFSVYGRVRDFNDIPFIDDICVHKTNNLTDENILTIKRLMKISGVSFLCKLL